jgi:DNA-binding transcriptional MerR regulator
MSFTIGKLAEAAGVHVETVRYYERRGLIDQPPRGGSGYRQYAADDLWRLQFIGRGKKLGFSLVEIGALLAEGCESGDGGEGAPGGPGAGSPAAVLAAARAAIEAVDERRRELDRQRCRLEQLAALCQDGADADCVALRIG